MSPTLILPSNSNIIPENTSPKIACNPNPIPTNRAAEPASKNVISIPTNKRMIRNDYNDKIFRTSVEELDKKFYDLVIIQWPAIHRKERYSDRIKNWVNFCQDGENLYGYHTDNYEHMNRDNPKMKSTSMLKLLMFKPCNVANIFQIEIKKIKKKLEINENIIVFLILIYPLS